MVKGKLAIVTGGGGGIGQATCQTLARDGANVVVTDINTNAAEVTLKSLSGTGHWSIHLDVTNEENVLHVFKCILDKYNSPPTIIINCAGTLKYIPSFLDESVKTMQHHFDVNFTGTFLVTQTVCKILKTSKLTGSIVNVSSFAATGYPGFLSYGGSKAAVICLTKAVAREMAQFGIRCNVVSPGGIETNMLRLIPNGVVELAMTNCPLKRIGAPQEVAALITFLASEKSTYTNASVSDINGGM